MTQNKDKNWWRGQPVDTEVGPLTKKQMREHFKRIEVTPPQPYMEIVSHTEYKLIEEGLKKFGDIFKARIYAWKKMAPKKKRKKK